MISPDLSILDRYIHTIPFCTSSIRIFLSAQSIRKSGAIATQHGIRSLLARGTRRSPVRFSSSASAPDGSPGEREGVPTQPTVKAGLSGKGVISRKFLARDPAGAVCCYARMRSVVSGFIRAGQRIGLCRGPRRCCCGALSRTTGRALSMSSTVTATSRRSPIEALDRRSIVPPSTEPGA